MNKVKLIADSTCDLTPEIIQENDITILPLYVVFENQSFKDGVDITTETLYEEVEKRIMLPKTAAIAPVDFIRYFTPYINQGMDIVFISIGSKISSTYNNAMIASLEFPEGRIMVVDSLNLSSAIGLLVLKACKMKNEGLSAREIKEKLDTLVPYVHAQFSVPNLEFLHKGGRCSGTKRFFGTMLRVKPIIRVKEGTLLLDDKAYGKYEKALDLMIDDLIAHQEILDLDCVMITHSFGDEEYRYILKHIPQNIKDKVELILQTKAGCVISSHCGKRTIGILYITKE